MLHSAVADGPELLVDDVTGACIGSIAQITAKADCVAAEPAQKAPSTYCPDSQLQACHVMLTESVCSCLHVNDFDSGFAYAE